MMRSIIAALCAVLASSYVSRADSSHTKLNCPKTLAISVVIGQLTVTDADAGEFASLSNLHTDGVFELATETDSCVMLERLQTDNVTVNHSTKRRYLEIKPTDSGSTLTIDTYTSSGKLYSIVSDLDSGDAVAGDYGAYVVERSGTRRYLGQAELSIEQADTADSTQP